MSRTNNNQRMDEAIEVLAAYIDHVFTEIDKEKAAPEPDTARIEALIALCTRAES